MIGTPTSGNTYSVGETVEVQLDFEEDVTVLGRPAIQLWMVYSDNRIGRISAGYVRGSGTDKLVFSFKVTQHPVHRLGRLRVDTTRVYYAKSGEGIKRKSNNSDISIFLVSRGYISPTDRRINGMNSPATGKPTISGRVEAEAGQYLEVSLDDVEDANGVPDKAASVSGWYGVPSAGYGSDYGPDGFATVTTNYRMTWQRVDADGFSNPTEVWNPFTTYKLTPADLGKRIRVRVRFIDNKGSAEEVVSDATPVVVSGAFVVSFCDRTPAVVDAIVAAVSGVTDCAEVTYAHLARIQSLRLSGDALQSSGLRTGDFTGLTGLTRLSLSHSGLTTLPPGVFDKLTALTRLSFGFNTLTTLPPGVFDKLTALIRLEMEGNALTALPPGVFDKLTAADTARFVKQQPDRPA